jgi:hypothetical protein
MSVKNLVKSKFDYDVSALPAYIDQERDQLLVRQVTDARSLNYVTVQSGVKGTEALKLMTTQVVYQTGGCGMTPSGNTVFTNRNITVNPIGYMQKFCNENLVGKWTQKALRAGLASQNEALPFEEAFTNHILELNALEVDKLIWQGDTDLVSGNLSFANGFKKNVTVGGGAVDLSGVGAITTTNAFSKFRQMTALMPQEIAEATDFTYFVDRATFLALMNNMIDLNLFHFNPTQLGDLVEFTFPTIGRVVSIPGLNGANVIYCGKAEEFIVGTDLESDFDELKIWYSEDNDDIRVRSKFRLGTQVPFPAQIGRYDGAVVSPSAPSPSASPSA